jgi:phenylacetate-CoA ligase
MNWRKPIVEGLLLISGSHIIKYLHQIEELEKQPPEFLKKYQENKLKKILLYAQDNVPYYHKINFNKLPILTKEIIRKQGKNLYSKDYKKRGFYNNSSGGSTGEPVKFIQDKEYYYWNVANKLFYKKSFGGQDVGDKELRLWGSERDLLKGKEKLSTKLKLFLYNRKELNSFRMSKDDMKRFVKIWNNYKPRWIEAYVQSIYEFAKFIKKNNINIESPKNGILTSAGTLYPDMKKTIQDVFKCPVFNRYGSREVGDMACGTNKLYLSVWNHYLEILDKNLQPCKRGKIYVTTLNNYSMPLIRYDIGDIGVQGKWNWIEKVEGREMSVFKTKEGKVIPAEFFIHFVGVVYNNGSIDKFQVIQKDYDSILIKIVVKDLEQFKSDKQKIESAIKLEMGKECKIKWEFVKEIEPLKSGKFLYTISEVEK